METFVLLPFFLLSRVPLDADTWRHGPEYTFVANANVSTLVGRSIINFSVYQIRSLLKCRPRNPETLHCQFGPANTTIHTKVPENYPRSTREDKDSWLHEPFDIRFNRRGIQGLVVHQDMDFWYLDIIRAFVSQMNLGVELLPKTDGPFTAMENTYFGQCESLVNVSRKAQGNEISRKRDYEIAPMAGLQKKPGETVVIEKTKDLSKCVDKRSYVISGENRFMVTRMISSRSRIEISDTDFDSYTENMIELSRMGISFSFEEKISLDLVCVLPAQEALEPVSNETRTFSPYVYGEEDY